MPTPIVEIAPITGAEYEYDYQQMHRLDRASLVTYCGSLRQRLAPMARIPGATEEWVARSYLSVKFILASTMMLSSAEFATKKNLRMAEPYLAYYAVFNVSRAFVLMNPDHRWEDGDLAYETTHTKLLNITHDYLRRLSPKHAEQYLAVSQRALRSRELFSYSFPASGLSSSSQAIPPGIDDLIDVCQAVAELAQLHSECIQSAFRKVDPVRLDKGSLTMRKLYEYEHRNGDSFKDHDDAYRLWQIERHMQRPLALHLMARPGLVEDFFGAWVEDDAKNEGCYDPDSTDWRIIFDFM